MIHYLCYNTRFFYSVLLTSQIPAFLAKETIDSTILVLQVGKTGHKGGKKSFCSEQCNKSAAGRGRDTALRSPSAAPTLCFASCEWLMPNEFKGVRGHLTPYAMQAQGRHSLGPY